jgi:anti-sigma regulatory factor (Ser/Thr protein kinase)
VIARGEAHLIHQALLYASTEQFLATAMPFVTAGLRNGDAIVAVTTDRNAALLRERLGVDATSVSFVAASGWYDAPGRALAAYYELVDEMTSRHGYLRVVADAAWNAADPLEISGWTRYESMVNVAFASSPTWIVCAYDQSALPAAVVEGARLTHPELTVGAGREPNVGYTHPEAYYAQHNEPLPPPPEDGVERLDFFADPSVVRHVVADRSVRLGVPLHRLHDLLICVNEAVTNAIRHGAGHGQVHLWAAGDWVVCDVTDPGTAHDRFLGYLRSDARADHGHGLWIARQLCDLMEIRTGGPGTTVRLYFRRGA